MSVLEKLDRHFALMDRMSETVGVDLADLMMRGRMPPPEFRDAVFRCTGCASSDACQDWMDAHPAGAGHAPGYCRNKAYLARLAQA